MKPSELFFTPKDVWRGVKSIRTMHLLGAACGIAVGLLVGKILGFGIEAGVFGGLLVMLLFWRVNAQVPFSSAIICFFLIIVTTIITRDTNYNEGENSVSERLAVWAFFFLIIGVALLIEEQVWPHKKDDAPKKAFVHPLQRPQQENTPRPKTLVMKAPQPLQKPQPIPHVLNTQNKNNSAKTTTHAPAPSKPLPQKAIKPAVNPPHKARPLPHYLPTSAAKFSDFTVAPKPKSIKPNPNPVTLRSPKPSPATKPVSQAPKRRHNPNLIQL